MAYYKRFFFNTYKTSKSTKYRFNDESKCLVIQNNYHSKLWLYKKILDLKKLVLTK